MSPQQLLDNLLPSRQFSQLLPVNLLLQVSQASLQRKLQPQQLLLQMSPLLLFKQHQQ